MPLKGIERMKYSHINLERTLVVRGHEYLYFTTWQEGAVYEWQRGSHTINVKARASFESQDLECFSMSYGKKRPSMRDAKCCILDYVNER